MALRVSNVSNIITNWMCTNSFDLGHERICKCICLAQWRRFEYSTLVYNWSNGIHNATCTHTHTHTHFPSSSSSSFSNGNHNFLSHFAQMGRLLIGTDRAREKTNSSYFEGRTGLSKIVTRCDGINDKGGYGVLEGKCVFVCVSGAQSNTQLEETAAQLFEKSAPERTVPNYKFARCENIYMHSIFVVLALIVVVVVVVVVVGIVK